MMTDQPRHSNTPPVRDDALAATLRQVVYATMNKTFNVTTRIEPWHRNKEPVTLAPAIGCMAEIRESGTPCGVFVTAFSTEVITKLLKTLGVPDTANREAIDDAIEEITNIMYGMIKTALNDSGHCLGAVFPVAIDEENAVLRRHQNKEKITLPFLADGHECKVMVALDNMTSH